MLRWLRNTSLKHIFVAVSAVFVLVTLALGSYALSVNRTQNESLDWSGGMFVAYNAMQSAHTDIVNARRGVRTYLLYGDEAGVGQYQQALDAFHGQMNSAFAALAAIDESDSELARQLAQLNADVEQWVAGDAEPSIALRRDWTGAEPDLQTAAFAWVQSPETQALFAPITTGFDTVIGQSEPRLTARVESIAQGNTRLTEALNITLPLMTILAIIAAALLYREIARPLERLSATARRIASGDLTGRIGIRQQNEIGSAAAAFDAMANRLQELVEHLESAQTELAERGARLGAILEGVGDAPS